MAGAGSPFGRPGTAFDAVVGVSTGSGGGGGSTTDTIARNAIAALVGRPGDTISDGEDTWIEGIGVWRNLTGLPLNIPDPASEANMLDAGFTRDTEDKPSIAPRVVSEDAEFDSGEHLVGNGPQAITLTLEAGATHAWVSRASMMAFAVDVVSAGAPTITISGEPTGVRLNQPAGPVLLIQDPDNTSNYLVVVPGPAGASASAQGAVSANYTTDGW